MPKNIAYLAETTKFETYLRMPKGLYVNGQITFGAGNFIDIYEFVKNKYPYLIDNDIGFEFWDGSLITGYDPKRNYLPVNFEIKDHI